MGKIEEILLKIHREVKERYFANPEYEELYALVCLELGTFYLCIEHEDAEMYLLEAFKLRERLYGSEEAWKLEDVMRKLGIFYGKHGKQDKAEVMFFDAYTISKELYERSDEFESDYAIDAMNLGTFYYESFRPEEALKYHFEALKHRHAMPFGEDIVYYNIALCYEDLNEIERAVEFYIKASASALSEGFIDIEETLKRSMKISSPDHVYFKLRELFDKKEIDGEVFGKLLSILERIGRCVSSSV